MTSILSRFIDSTAKRPQGKWARQYYGEPKSHMKAFAQTMEALAPRPDDAHLEIGCGGGYFLGMIQPKVARVAAIDHSPEMVEVARRANHDAVAAGLAEIVQGDAERLPWPDDSFTCSANTSMWFFLEHPERVLAELRRVLKPGGRLVITTIRRSWFNRLVWALYGLRLYSNRQMARMLGDGGFCEIEVVAKGLMGQIVTARKPAASGQGQDKTNHARP